MKQHKISLLFISLVIMLVFGSVAAQAAVTDRAAPPLPLPPASNRIIVKFKPLHLRAGLTSAQIAAELALPLSADTLNKLQTASGMNISESHALSGGAHVLILHGRPGKQAMAQAVGNIGKLADIEYAEEDQILTPQAIPNDPSYGTLWGMQPVSPVTSPAPGGTGSYGADMESAWNTSTGTGAVVAVIDTGITAHAELSGNLASAGYTFISDCRIRGITATGGCASTTPDTSASVQPTSDASDTGDYIDTADSTSAGSFFLGLPVKDSSWHGTHVSGTIAAIGNNNTGVIGGAFTAKILPVRVLGKGGGYTSDIAEGMLWAAGLHSAIANPNPARVLNFSLGGTGSCSITSQNAINAVVAAGAVVVVAAGNSNTDVATASPANCNNVISVSAIGRDGSRAVYSNYSSPDSNTSNPLQVTLAAQGGDKSLGAGFDPGIYSTGNSGTTTVAAASYTYKQGTSMATPHVSATAALMLSRNAALTPAQVKNILSVTVTGFPSFSSSGWVDYDCATLKNCGSGILNANLAVLGSKPLFTPSSLNIDFGTLTTSDTLSKTVTLTNNSGGAVTLGSTTLTGPNTASFNITGNTCTGTIANSANCMVTVSFSPKALRANFAGIYIPAQPASLGATMITLTGVASAPLTATAALAASRNSTGGGCSIMPATGQADFSLLLFILIILLYSCRQRFALGKN